MSVKIVVMLLHKRFNCSSTGVLPTKLETGVLNVNFVHIKHIGVPTYKGTLKGIIWKVVPCSRICRGTSCRRCRGGRARRRRSRCSRARTRTAPSGSRRCRSRRCRAGTPACTPRRRTPSGTAGRSAGRSSRSSRCTGLEEKKEENVSCDRNADMGKITKNVI